MTNLQDSMPGAEQSRADEEASPYAVTEEQLQQFFVFALGSRPGLGGAETGAHSEFPATSGTCPD
jgi:hypothetical protein